MVGRREEEERANKIIRRSTDDICLCYDVLPEGCIATTISLTGPRDACRLAAVSIAFKSAAESDAVWCRFLPSDYLQILARSVDRHRLSLLHSLSKKDLFFSLVDHPLLLDGSTKSFFLEKLTGKKCYILSARELTITWGDTPRYWAFHSLPESRFPEVAELNSVCWLEIKGEMKTSMLSPDTTYAAYLVFKMAEAAYGFYFPAHLSITSPGGKTVTRKVYLGHEEGRNQRYRILPRRIGIGMGLFNRIRNPLVEGSSASASASEVKILPNVRKDGWLEVEIGEVFTQAGEDGEVEMSVLEIEAGNWKSGLVVEGIEIRPKITT